MARTAVPVRRRSIRRWRWMPFAAMSVRVRPNASMAETGASDLGHDRIEATPEAPTELMASFMAIPRIVDVSTQRGRTPVSAPAGTEDALSGNAATTSRTVAAESGGETEECSLVHSGRTGRPDPR